MNNTRSSNLFPYPRRPVNLLAAAIALAAASQAQAVSFSIGEIEGQFDSSLSIGASWAVRSPDPDFIGVASGGQASSATLDDNRLNFKKGETFSKIFKGIHDLELKYGESGALLRGKYWYDFELKDEHRLFYDIDDSGRDRGAKAAGAMLLDAFVYHNYTLGDLAGNVRLGRQVVSWGESTFIQNSINSINPVDVAALRRPGAEVKEGLLPVSLLYVSQGLTDNLTLESFYQLEWEKTVVDNCGTFFGSDAVQQGCDDRLVAAGPDLPQGDPLGNVVNAYFPRSADRDARDSGQYGLALRWYVPELNDSEFGAYVMNYHSRNPYLGFTSGQNVLQVGPVAAIRSARYFIEYPEDIRLYGLSFQTSLGTTSVAGEISYRPNMPLALSSPDYINAGIGNPTSPLLATGYYPFVTGADVPTYKRMPVLQMQSTVTQFFDQVWGADRLTLVGEVGYTRINGLGPSDGTDLRFGRSPIFGSGELPGAANAIGCETASNPQRECNSHGFYTTDSWGYRARAILNYSNVVAGINLSPSLAWSHDVDGWGPSFEEGAKAVSLGLDADYRSIYTASLSYTDYFGGRFNTNLDRDFVSFSVGVNF